MHSKPPMDLILGQAGAECIYKEGRIICHARLAALKADDRLLEAEVIPLPAPGLFTPGERWTIGAIWGNFHWDTASWTFACAALVWRIYFDQTLIREVRELGARLKDVENEQERREQLLNCIRANEIRRQNAEYGQKTP